MSLFLRRDRWYCGAAQRFCKYRRLYSRSSMEASAEDPWQLGEALHGDSGAWGRLVDEFSDTIWHWARSQGLTREDAEDVCQTVWYRLKDRGHTIADRRRLAGWLATTTRREAQALSARRRRAASAEITLVAVEHLAVVDQPSAFEITLGNETYQRLCAAFEALSLKCRELLGLLWDNMLSYQDVSELLGIPVGSIGPTRQRCLQSLREHAAIA